MKKTFAVLIAMSLAACGGGGSPEVPDQSQAIGQALTNIAAKTPAAPAFTGAFVLVEGISAGYFYGTSERDVAVKVATLVKDEPVKYAALYQKLLSDAGLKITVPGKQTGMTGPTGIPIHYPDAVFTAKLTTNGLVVTQ